MSGEFSPVHTPLPGRDHTVLEPPRPFHSDSRASTSQDSYAQATETPRPNSPLLASSSPHDAMYEKSPYVRHVDSARRSHRTRNILIGLAAIAVAVVAIVLAVYFAVIRPKHHDGNSSSGSSGAKSNPGSPTGALFGGDGSQITAADGTTFTYKNPYGGIWVEDPNNPFNNSARPQSWSPALNEQWTWGKDIIHGVNLGGWFVTEPFIAPALYEKYQHANPPAADEWTLSQAMAADKASGGLNQLEDHYKTFITEKDFAEIAGAGLNWVRLAIPFWAVETIEEEPFLAKVSWKYIVQAFQWARKYGLRIYLDLHTVPGSQNGYNHSGKGGQVNFLNGVMGLANAQRIISYIRTITEFISQSEYVDVVPMFGIMNEPLVSTIGQDVISHFYLHIHDMVRNITGTGEGKGPYIALHDGFIGVDKWAGFLPGSDRVVLDTHPYFAFDGQPNNGPVSSFWPMPCTTWAPGINQSQSAFGPTIAGEWSVGINDCGEFLLGITGKPSYAGDCSFWEDSTQWNQTIKDGLKQYAQTSMDALQNWFFWTWKIGNSSVTNSVRSPLWSYQLGLENGWIPEDPRSAVGACAAVGVPPQNSFDGSYSAWQTGGSGAGTIAASVVASLSAWPPPTLAGITPSDAVSLVPTYTSTGPILTLSTPTFTAGSKTLSGGNGWTNDQDTGGGVVSVAGCSYPDPWNAVSAPMPTAACTGNAANRRAMDARATPPPLAQ